MRSSKINYWFYVAIWNSTNSIFTICFENLNFRCLVLQMIKTTHMYVGCFRPLSNIYADLPVVSHLLTLTIKRLLQCSETCTVFYKIHVLCIIIKSNTCILFFFSCRIHILKMGKCINCMKWEKRFQNIVHKGYKRWGFFKITQNKIYIDVYLIFSFWVFN